MRWISGWEIGVVLGFGEGAGVGRIEVAFTEVNFTGEVSKQKRSNFCFLSS